MPHNPNKKLLQDKIAHLERAYIIATDASERFKLQHQISELKEQLGEPTTSETTKVQQQPSRKKRLWATIPIVIGVLAGIAEISGYSLRDCFTAQSASEEIEGVWIRGRVRDMSTQKALAGARILVGADTILYSDSLGRIRAYLPPDMQRDVYTLEIEQAGYESYREAYSPASTDFDIRLEAY